MNKLPISICMIGKNEERFLEGCLEKLVPYGFEIIFTDTGSTDRTKEIARKYTEHVYDFVWCNDFSAARNFSASKAGNDRVIALDCDEYIKELNLTELMQELTDHPAQIGMIEVENIIRNDDSYGRNTESVARVYNRQNCCFFGKVHEQLREINGNPVSVYHTSVKVVHYGYALPPEEAHQKAERNISLLLEESRQSPKEPYYYFQLGQAYASINDYEKVFQYLNTGLSLDPDPEQPYTRQMLLNYGTAMLNTGRYEMALNMESMYDFLCDYSDYLFLLGRIYYANHMTDKALIAFEDATKAPQCIVFGTNSLFPLNSMALIYEEAGQTELADMYRKQVDQLISG